MLALLVEAAVAGPAWRVDTSPLAAVDGAWPLATSLRCPEAGFSPLGVSMVIYGRRSGASSYGHASLRATWCDEGALFDAAYEVYRLGAWNEDMLRLDHAGEAWLDGDDGWLRTQRGAAVLFRDEHPLDGGWFRDAMTKNREVYELWLDLPPERSEAVIRGVEEWYAAQQATLEAHDDLGPSYVLWSRNCTMVLRRLLPELDPGSSLPFAWLRALEDDALLRVLHPSAAVARRLDAGAGGWPAEVERPHPLIRWGRRWPDDVPTGEPVGPWSIQG